MEEENDGKDKYTERKTANGKEEKNRTKEKENMMDRELRMGVWGGERER